MTILIAIPAYKVSCRVTIDKARPWSIVDELILWAVSRESKTIASLSRESKLPERLIVASIARMMRFRLIEVVITAEVTAFRASSYGSRIVNSGETLPYFPKTQPRRVSFVVEKTAGDFFPNRDVNFMSNQALEKHRETDVEIRRVAVVGEDPPMSHDANFDRLADIVSRGWGDQISNIDGLGASVAKGYVVVRYLDGAYRSMPEEASEKFKGIITDVATGKLRQDEYKVFYSAPPVASPSNAKDFSCSFDEDDLIVGGEEQRNCLIKLLTDAKRRVILHSTFLDAAKFSKLLKHFRIACTNGVKIDILWGGDKDDDTAKKNWKAATEIAEIVRRDSEIRFKIKVHLTPTGSHAKFILADTSNDNWVAAVGSCNWLSTPFESVELSVILRAPQLVAELAVAIQRMTGERGLSDNLATELAFIARDLRTMPPADGEDRMRLLIGDEHETIMRRASGDAKERLTIGSNKIGSTIQTGALMPGQVAVTQNEAKVTLLYNSPSGPLKGKNEFVRSLSHLSTEAGIRLIRTGNPKKLHGKFIAWDDNDIVVTSMNWASASGNVDFPWSEIGIHIRCSGISTRLHAKLLKFFHALAK